MRTSEIGRSVRASSSRFVVTLVDALAGIAIINAQQIDKVRAVMGKLIVEETKRKIDLVIRAIMSCLGYRSSAIPADLTEGTSYARLSLMSTNLLRTSFYDFHIEHGGKMVDFAGWEMPLLYSSILEEHRHCRTSAGFFDVSHIDQLASRKSGACKLNQEIFARAVH